MVMLDESLHISFVIVAVICINQIRKTDFVARIWGKPPFASVSRRGYKTVSYLKYISGFEDKTELM